VTTQGKEHFSMTKSKRKQFETTPERREQMEQLVAFIEAQDHGAELSWLAIEHDTGVPMDQLGRAMVRRAVRKCGLVHASKPGYGIELSSPANAVGIIGHACARVGGAIRGAKRSHERLMKRHGDEMTPDQRAKMAAVESLLGGATSLASRAVVKMLRE